MFFKKSNKYYEENTLIKEKLESLSPAQVCGLALLYMDYRLNYNKKDMTNKDAKYKLCVFMLFEECKQSALNDEFFSLNDFAYSISKVCNKVGGFQSIECFLDWLKLEQSGPTGRMDFKRKAEILQLIKFVLEEYYELGVTRIVKFASNM